VRKSRERFSLSVTVKKLKGLKAQMLKSSNEVRMVEQASCLFDFQKITSVQSHLGGVKEKPD